MRALIVHGGLLAGRLGRIGANAVRASQPPSPATSDVLYGTALLKFIALQALSKEWAAEDARRAIEILGSVGALREAISDEWATRGHRGANDAAPNSGAPCMRITASVSPETMRWLEAITRGPDNDVCDTREYIPISLRAWERHGRSTTRGRGCS